MIALLFSDACTGCNTCVSICPTRVFDEVPGAAPHIARPDACQTCYLCELYCLHDALYVAPEQFLREPVDPAAVRASGALGRLRRDAGWTNDPAAADLEVYRLLGPLLNEGADIHAAHYAAMKGAADTA